MENKLFPLKKHKDQPMEIVLKDRNYCEWLTTQDWFREKYQSFYQIIINNFGEPSETPEHNILQVRFIDDKFCFALAKLYGWLPVNVIGKMEKTKNEFYTAENKFKKLPEKYGLNHHSKEYYIRNELVNNMNELKDDIKAYLEINDFLINENPVFNFLKKYEIGGWDVALSIYTTPINFYLKLYYLDNFKFAIEIKNNLGDDYPAILRQMKASDPKIGHPCLIYDKFTATGASLEDIKNIFTTSNYRIFSIKEIEDIKCTL